MQDTFLQPPLYRLLATTMKAVSFYLDDSFCHFSPDCAQCHSGGPLRMIDLCANGQARGKASSGLKGGAIKVRASASRQIIARATLFASLAGNCRRRSWLSVTETKQKEKRKKKTHPAGSVEPHSMDCLSIAHPFPCHAHLLVTTNLFECRSLSRQGRHLASFPPSDCAFHRLGDRAGRRGETPRRVRKRTDNAAFRGRARTPAQVPSRGVSWVFRPHPF